MLSTRKASVSILPSASLRAHRARAQGFLLVFLAGAAMLFATILDAALDHVLERHQGAGGTTSALLRALDAYVGFFRVLDDAPLLGYGIGAGTPTARMWV